MNEYADIFKALGDVTRLRILNLLLQAGKKLCVCEIVDALHLPQYRVSKSLALLKNSKLVTVAREGTWVYYGLNPELPPFFKAIFSLMKKHFQDVFSDDAGKIHSRLALRENGKCVIGFKCNEKK
ncbi:MAG: helix-turn-helix transcriptional regulator [Nitrospinae bacterium]|nr:helix-turn-helix transcriptional regulator [Nitrospinota bacterium]